MNEIFATDEMKLVGQALREFERRCEEILMILDEKIRLSPQERSKVEMLYKSLKEDLKLAAKYGTVSGLRHSKTRPEECFYDPAVRRAATKLRPATNSNPVSSGWSDAVSDAREEFSYYLHNLANIPTA